MGKDVRFKPVDKAATRKANSALKQSIERLHTIRIPGCSKHSCDVKKYPFMSPDMSRIPKINKQIPRLCKRGCKVYEVGSFYTHAKFKRSVSCGDIPRVIPSGYFDDGSRIPSGFLPPILTRGVELKRAFMRKKLKLQMKKEKTERKMFRRVKLANNKICKFGYGSKSKQGGSKSARKAKKDVKEVSCSEDSVDGCSCLDSSFEADSIDSGSELTLGVSSMPFPDSVSSSNITYIIDDICSPKRYLPSSQLLTGQKS